MDEGKVNSIKKLDDVNLYDDIFNDITPDLDTEPSNTIDNELETEVIDDKPVINNDLILEVLKLKNINPESIKFENDNGEIEEYNWENLSLEEQKNILISNDLDNDYGLEEDEINIINNFRESKLSYNDYINNIKIKAVEEYLQENNPYKVYSIDDYTDDDLYLLDLKTKMEDLTDEELVLALETEKSNPTLYGKKINALRNEYKNLEEAKIQAEQELEEQENAKIREEFENTIKTNVNNLNSIGNLELSEDEKNNIYNFITGTNSAGESLISTALNDPEKLVKMVWFTLYGEQGFNIIQDYFTKQLAESRKEIKSGKSTLVHAPKNNNQESSKKELQSISSLYSLDN